MDLLHYLPMTDLVSKRPGRGRRPVPKHEKRISCHGIRLPAYWMYFLKKHPRKAARMIEAALENTYDIDKEAVIKEFYDAARKGK